MQQRREGTKKLGQVAVRSDGFGYLEERAVSLDRREVRGFRIAGARHGLSLASLRVVAQGASTWRSRREAGMKSRHISANLRWGFWLNDTAAKLAGIPTIKRVLGKELLKFAIGAAADCHRSRPERLSDKRAGERGEGN